MDAEDLIKAGRLAEARKQLVDEVKTSPSDSAKRALLFQVLSFYGEWDRAGHHLGTLAAQDSKMETGAQVYRNLIHGEKERADVLKLHRRPSFLPATPPYLETYFAAWEKVIGKEVEEARGLFDRIDEQRPVVSGTVDGKNFNGFKDTDAFLSLFLEAIVHERYVWLPFESIRELSVSSPKTLFDLLWIPARVTTWEELTLNCYLPVLYPESFLHEDDRIKLGRMTDWTPLGGPFSKGMGQHVFEVGEEELPLLEIREALFNTHESVRKDEKSH
jgi:type VI secretion system protein ImpE